MRLEGPDPLLIMRSVGSVQEEADDEREEEEEEESVRVRLLGSVGRAESPSTLRRSRSSSFPESVWEEASEVQLRRKLRSEVLLKVEELRTDPFGIFSLFSERGGEVPGFGPTSASMKRRGETITVTDCCEVITSVLLIRSESEL